MVGKRIESRGQADAPPLADPLAALDRARQPPPGVAAPAELTFPSRLRQGPGVRGQAAAKPVPVAQAGASRRPTASLKPVAAVAKPLAPRRHADRALRRDAEVAAPHPRRRAAAPARTRRKRRGKFTLQLSTFATAEEAARFATALPRRVRDRRRGPRQGDLLPRPLRQLRHLQGRDGGQGQLREAAQRDRPRRRALAKRAPRSRERSAALPRGARRGGRGTLPGSRLNQNSNPTFTWKTPILVSPGPGSSGHAHAEADVADRQPDQQRRDADAVAERAGPTVRRANRRRRRCR